MPIIEDLADEEDSSASTPAPDLHIGLSARHTLPMTKRLRELLAAAENPPVAPDLLPSSPVVTARNCATHVPPLKERKRSSIDREAARKEYESAFNNGEYNVLEGMTAGATGSDHSMTSNCSSTGVRKSLTPPITPAAPAKRPAKRLLSRRRAMPIDSEPEISPRLMNLDFTTVDAAAHNFLPTRRSSTPHGASQPMSSRSLNQLKQSLMVGSQCVTLKQSPRLLHPIDKSASPRLLTDPTSLRSMEIRGIISKPRCSLLGSSCLPPIPAVGSAAG